MTHLLDEMPEQFQDLFEECVNQGQDSPLLTTWERDFLENIGTKHFEYGGRLYLSQKQVDVIINISHKIGWRSIV